MSSQLAVSLHRLEREVRGPHIIPLALIAPQLRHAHRRAQFPGFLPAVCARPRAHARNTLALSPGQAPATINVISPATRWISGSKGLSLVVSIVVIASPM